MNKKILYTIVLLSVAWILVLPQLNVYEYLAFDSYGFTLLQASAYLALGAIVFVAIYALKRWSGSSNAAISEFDEPIVPARILSLIIILGLLIYPAFFIDKGYFSNSLVSSIDVLEIEQLNLNSEISAGKEIQLEISDKVKLTSVYEDPSELESELESAQRKVKSNLRKHELNLQRITNLKNRLVALQEANHFENLYYVMRALCLGALGAILTLLATSSIKSKKIRSYNSLFNESNYWQSLITNSLAGSIVSVVAFALFYTKQISIFDSTLDVPNHAPDFWRSTLLCLIAGAFAEKIYQAVSTKVDDYVDNKGGSDKTVQPTQKNKATDG